MKNWIAILVGFIAVSSVSAEVVINNLASSSSGHAAFQSAAPGPYYQMAVKFTATQSFAGISDLKLNLFQGTAVAGTYTVKLYSNTGSGDSAKPLSSLDTLASGNWNTLGTTSDSFVSFSNITLGATRSAGSYWIMVESGFYSTGNRWGFGQATSDKNLNATADGGAWTNMVSAPLSYWTNANNLGASVTTAVPEPSTMVLGGIAALCGGGGVWVKRRKKKVLEVGSNTEPVA